MPSLIEETALRVGQGLCDLAAAVLFGQFRCRDPEALTMVGYVVVVLAIAVTAWLVFVRPRAE